MTGSIAPPEPIDKTKPRKPTRARGREFPSPELFPADLYVELIASQEASVEDELAAAFYSKKSEARDKVLRIAEGQKALFDSALDYVAGAVGLRLNYQFINKPIDSQCFAYRRKGEPYAFSFSIEHTTLEACQFVLREHKTRFQRTLPKTNSRLAGLIQGARLAFACLVCIRPNSKVRFIVHPARMCHPTHSKSRIEGFRVGQATNGAAGTSERS